MLCVFWVPQMPLLGLQLPHMCWFHAECPTMSPSQSHLIPPCSRFCEFYSSSNFGSSKISLDFRNKMAFYANGMVFSFFWYLYSCCWVCFSYIAFNTLFLEVKKIGGCIESTWSLKGENSIHYYFSFDEATYRLKVRWFTTNVLPSSFWGLSEPLKLINASTHTHIQDETYRQANRPTRTTNLQQQCLWTDRVYMAFKKIGLTSNDYGYFAPYIDVGCMYKVFNLIKNFTAAWRADFLVSRYPGSRSAKTCST